MDFSFSFYLHGAIVLALAVRVLLQPRLEPSARLAWVLVISLVPVLGVLAYVLFGEIRVGRAEMRARRGARDEVSRLYDASAPPPPVLPEAAVPVALSAQAVGGLQVVGGNRIALLAEDDSAFDPIIRAIDGAQDHVHLLFYIWLADASGGRVAAAAIRAAQRGVTVRVIVDEVGSRPFMRSPWWDRMVEAGVECRAALPVGIPLLRALEQRLDLRNHRKIVLIDGAVAFTGSRNCADLAFRHKPEFAPWIDIMVETQGPVVRQMQTAFIVDWVDAGGEYLPELLAPEDGIRHGDVSAQMIPTGPDRNAGSMSETFSTLIHAARRRIVICTPYYVPDEPLDSAIKSAARRGVEVHLILPGKNDSLIVAATSQGFWRSLLNAGVQMHLFHEGLLHSKIVTADGGMAIIGSANLDRRSFELNYELNMLIVDPITVAALDLRQLSYIERSRRVTLDEVRAWPWWQRMRNNILALASPLL
ncbi:cardiolipin synthase [Paracoccus sp. Z118]|uniref:cardiolipin synthase n=1 Tax=Paracoccus sp. Z118 TaxID=2851017 RepID=UPI001C2B9727|nr:cardiolipin synthase [Paracoccus sp. Z118]MBV0891747.1 cardiolipin synthase [Paracoccus sp. Z118]